MKTASKSKARVAHRMPARPAKKALMRIPAPASQPWALTLDEVSLVKNHIAKGATDEELKFCLAVARRFKLDPFRQQIWFVKRNDKSAEGGTRWIPITGINGLLHIAARDHRDFGSNDEPEYGPMHKVSWSYYDKSGKLDAPEWARVKVWKKGLEHPVVATVYWDEIYPDVGVAPLVRQMPRLMLGKCALAQAIRRAYPATDGLYIKEEFQGPSGLTPGGRVMTIEQEAEVNPHLKKYLDSESNHTAAQQEVIEKKMAELKKDKEPEPAECEIVSYPERDDGDVFIRASDATATLLGMTRRSDTAGCWCVKFSKLTKFHDLAREKGVEVKQQEEK